MSVIRLQIRRGTAAQWTAANPTLANGEQGLETDTRRRKTGDGATAWTALAYDLDQNFADGRYLLQSIARDTYGPMTQAFELLPMTVYGHSWFGADGISATVGARIQERVKSRLRMGAITNNGVPGFTIEDISTLALGGPRAWTPTRALLLAVCTINNLTLFRTPTQPKFTTDATARRSYRWAWRALLARLTASAVQAGNTPAFSYDATFSAEVAATSALQAASVAASGGSRWKTSTVGGQARYSFTGDATTLVLTARAAGAGLVTVTDAASGSTLSTLDLTAAAAQDTPAVLPISGMGSGTHTVVLTLTSGASLTIDSALQPSSAAPPVVVLGEPAVASPTYAEYNADLGVYKTDLASICAEFPSSVRFIDLARVPGYDPATMLSDDGKHPNDLMCAWIASAVVSQLLTVPFNSGINLLSAAAGPAYVPPSSPAIPAGGQDGTGNPGVAATVGDSQVTLNWSRLAVPVGTTDWSIQRRVSPAGAVTTVTQGSTATSKTLTGLANSTAYDFRVASVVGGVVGTYSAWVTAAPNLIYVTDSFTGPDSTTGLIGRTTETGAKVWACDDVGATWGLLTGKAYCSGGANSTVYVDSGFSHVRVKATLSLVPAGGLGGLVLRRQDKDNYFHAAIRGTASVLKYSISKRVAGTLSVLADTAVTPTAGDVVEFLDDGTTISLIVNGTTLATTTDTAFATATKQGLYGNFTGGGSGGRYALCSIQAA